MAKHSTAENQPGALHLSSLQALAVQPHLLTKVVHASWLSRCAGHKSGSMGLGCALREPLRAAEQAGLHVGLLLLWKAAAERTPAMASTLRWLSSASCLGIPIRASCAILPPSLLLFLWCSVHLQRCCTTCAPPEVAPCAPRATQEPCVNRLLSQVTPKYLPCPEWEVFAGTAWQAKAMRT